MQRNRIKDCRQGADSYFGPMVEGGDSHCGPWGCLPGEKQQCCLGSTAGVSLLLQFHGDCQMPTVFEEEAVPIWFHWLIEYKQNEYMQNIVYVHIENPDMTLPPCSMRCAPAAFPREHNLCLWCLESRPWNQAWARRHCRGASWGTALLRLAV